MSLINARLSDDVFMFVFEHVHDLCGNPPAAVDDAIVLSHVCRRWRRVAENTPLLWATFWFGRSHADLIAKQLKQVGGLPVTIVWHTQKPHLQTSLAMLATILQSKARVGDVSLTFCREEFTTVLQLLQHSPRHTTSLSLEGLCTDECKKRHLKAQAPLDIISERQLWATLPTFTPALLSLTIERLPWFAPDPGAWIYLNTLIVDKPRSWHYTSQELSIGEIHERLRAFPTLKFLDVTELDVDCDDMLLSDADLVAHAPGELVFPGHRLHLPNLRFLRLDLLDAPHMVEFCRSIAVQPDCKFSSLIDIAYISQDRALLLKHIFPFGTMHRPTIGSVDYSSGLELSFQGGTRTGEDFQTSVTMCREREDGEDAPLTAQAFSLYNFAHLRELTIDIDDPRGEFYSMVWGDVFGPCSSVETLILGGVVIPAFIEQCHTGLQLQPLEVPFPRIIMLQCRWIDAAELQLLHEALTERLFAGFGPQQLKYKLLENGEIKAMITVDLRANDAADVDRSPFDREEEDSNDSDDSSESDTSSFSGDSDAE